MKNGLLMILFNGLFFGILANAAPQPSLVRMEKNGTGFCNTIDVRRFGNFTSIGTYSLCSMVIGKNKNDVGLLAKSEKTDG